MISQLINVQILWH